MARCPCVLLSVPVYVRATTFFTAEVECVSLSATDVTESLIAPMAQMKLAVVSN